MRRWNYGLTAEQYAEFLVKQKNACGLCNRRFTKQRTPRVDHDHQTGKIRGLLCNGCNTGLGKLGDTMTGLLRALQYLVSNQ